MSGLSVWGDGGQLVTPDDVAQKRALAQALIGQSQQPANYWTQGAANMVNAFLGGFENGRANKEQAGIDDYNSKIVQGLFGNGAAPASTPVPTVAQAPAPASAPDYGTSSASPVAHALGQNMAVDDFTNRLMKAESGGDPSATNPASTARGLYQITAPTQAGIARNHPEANIPATGTMTPEQQKVAALLLDQDNRSALAAQGVQPTDANAYGAWFLGAPTAAKVLTASDSTPVSALTGAGAVQANPFLKNMTVGDFRNWAAGKIGSPATPTAQPAPAAVQPQAPMQAAPAMPQQTGPGMQQLLAAMSDPRANQQTRGIASALLQNRMQQDDEARQIQMKQADPLYQAQLQEYGARTATLQQKMNWPLDALTPEQRNLAWRAQQGGLIPGSPEYQQFMMNGGPAKAPLVAVNTGNGSIADTAAKAYAQKSGENLAATELAGDNAGSLLGLGKTLEYLAPQLGGGGLSAEAINRVGAFMPDGWKPQGQSAREQFQSLVSDAIRQSHVPGEGPQSDADAARLATTMPQIMNSTAGNVGIARTIQALAQRKIDMGRLAGQEGRGEITPQQRADAVAKLPDPYASVRPYFEPQQSARTGRSATNPQTGARLYEYSDGKWRSN